MGGLRAILWLFACALPLAVAAQEPERVDPGPARVTVDVEDLQAEIPSMSRAEQTAPDGLQGLFRISHFVCAVITASSCAGS